MPKIRVLPETLSNKIAAGEVIERPASVVKELVENALDAGSTRIIIEVEEGGLSLIQVSDNGTGMSHADALLAIERHATSKISTDDDLFAIRTLGFRGEALPSIASVSQFAMITRDPASDSGTEILVEGGKITGVSEVGAPQGTLISVRHLFFNTPARRKFLKSVSTEMSHIADTVARMALGHPGIQFRLLHNGKVVKNWAVAPRHLDRVADVLGREAGRDLHGIQFNRDGISVSGWVSSPRTARRTSKGIYIFVNGRYVRDRTIQHAIFDGYAQRLVKGQFPIAVVFIQVPFDTVDVNVHPTKNEVRFANPRQMHQAVKSAVAQTLYEADRLDWLPVHGPKSPEPQKSPQIAEPVLPFPASGKRVEFGMGHGAWGMEHGDGGINGRGRTTAVRDQHPASSIEYRVSSIQHPASSIRGKQEPMFERKGFSALRVIGQLHNTYIVCESDAGLVLIDQHAAHERIFYEKLKQSRSDRPSGAQKLLVPETLELNFREAEILEQMLGDLNTLGLEIEPFGKNTFVIKAVPALLSGQDPKPVVREIVEKMAGGDSSAGLKEVLDECRMVMACHAAIRANQQLSAGQIGGLLSQLDQCESPSHCPHGRPTWIRWDLRLLEKSFKRIV
jgi:DNA mismatch repair protein MutL